MADPGTFTALHIAVTALVTAAAGLPVIPWRLRATYRAEVVILAALARCSRVRVAAQRQHACTQRRRCRPVQRERLGGTGPRVRCPRLLRRSATTHRRPQVRPNPRGLTLISLVVCVITI